MITINLIADAPACDIVTLTLGVKILSIVILFLKLSLKVMAYVTNRVVLILPLTRKPQVALPLTQKPLLTKTCVFGKSTNSLFANHHKQPESAIKGPTHSLVGHGVTMTVSN